MKRILALLIAACTATSSLAATPSKPNVIIILADDLGYGVLNAYGGDPKRVATPNIDRLASQGAKFSNGYVTCSVCGPSRAGLMTGRYQHRFGIYANCDLQSEGSGVPSEQQMMPKYFKDAGYRTAMIGKWHLGVKNPGQHPLERGFDEYFGFDSSQTDYFKSPILFEGRIRAKKHDYLTRTFTDRAIQFIEKGGDKPIFIYLAYNAVHGPNQAPQERIDQFSHLPPKEAIQAAMVAELDDGVGRLLQALERSGEDKNTLIIFLSDNGGLHNWWQSSNGNLRGFKRFQYDGGNKVPFIVRWPASVPSGQVRQQIANSLDILPTALEAAGITPPTDVVLDGVSLLPSLKIQQDLNPDRALFWAGSHFEVTNSKGKEWEGHDNPPAAWAIRRGDWKLMQIMEQGSPVLFNLAEDPAETTDLAERHPKVAAELHQAWVQWFNVGAKPIAWKTEYYQQLKALK
jgi:arylsulfatase A-like enzyme